MLLSRAANSIGVRRQATKNRAVSDDVHVSTDMMSNAVRRLQRVMMTTIYQHKRIVSYRQQSARHSSEDTEVSASSMHHPGQHH